MKNQHFHKVLKAVSNGDINLFKTLTSDPSRVSEIPAAGDDSVQKIQDVWSRRIMVYIMKIAIHGGKA